MLNRTIQSAFLVAALVLASAIPAGAQSLGVGLSFLGDHGGTGLILDYSKPFENNSGDKVLGWVGDFSFFHEGGGNALVGASVNTLMVQGGVRMTGKAGENLDWLGQGLVGLRRSSASLSGAATLCGVVNCSASDTGGVLTIGGGIQYHLSAGAALRGQLDFPIAIGSDGGSTTRFSLMYVMIMR